MKKNDDSVSEFFDSGFRGAEIAVYVMQRVIISGKAASGAIWHDPAIIY